MKAIRFITNPIISPATPGFKPHEGDNINGPSLIRVPEWVKTPLGRYYLYFGHHAGNHIRMAFADALEGPWQVYPGGVMHLHDTGMERHISSPDIIIDEENRQLLMYFHGVSPDHTALAAKGEEAQRTAVAMSSDGLHFNAYPQELGPFYFRVFRYGGYWYALTKPGNGTQVFRSKDGMTPFEPGPRLLTKGRHTAVQMTGDTLQVFYSNVGDAPEHILYTSVDLSVPWESWRCGDDTDILLPEHEYEGGQCENAPSVSGSTDRPVRQLRDPAVYTEGGKTYLLYAVAGEQGIAVAELIGFPGNAASYL